MASRKWDSCGKPAGALCGKVCEESRRFPQMWYRMVLVGSPEHLPDLHDQAEVDAAGRELLS